MDKKEDKKEEKKPVAPEVVGKKEDSKANSKIDTEVKEKSDYKPVFKIDLKPKVPNLPDYKSKSEINVKYPLMEPFVYAHIYWDEKEQDLIYELKEPILDKDELKILRTLEKGIEELINISFIGIKTPEAVIEFLEKNVKVLLNELGIDITKDTFLKIMYYIFRDFVGLNKIEPLMKDYFIEDIECNGINSNLYIVHRKYRNIRTNIVYKDIPSLTSFVEKIAQKCGKYISYASPLLDGSLPDGSRVNATYTQDISSKGPTFCFTDGYFQLSDGEVLKIGELFEECKNNFGFKIEKGNEVVETNNMSCCGVNGKDLNQVNSKLKTVIKLQPPKKLVKIKFNDGAEITTTTNHLFHVAGANLSLMEAEKLKENMFVPMPSKVNVNGCVQTINVAGLIKDFSYVNKICVVSSAPIKELVNNKVLNYQNQFKNHKQRLSQEYGVHNSYFYEILNRGSSISFEVLDKICNNINNLGELSVVVYGGGTKGKSKAIKLPNIVDEDLAYLAGAVISDGHLRRASIDIACYEEGFRDAVISKLIKKFGKAETYYDGKRAYLCNLFVPYFFNKVFGIPYGKKCNVVKVPKIIFKSDNKVIASFIKGLFDGDGTCRSGLSYKTNSKRLAEELTYLLSRLGIYSKINYDSKAYKVTIPSIYEKAYYNKIGFNNKFKSECLNELIDKKYSNAKSYINSGRVPTKPILELMEKVGISKNRLTKLCGFGYNRFYYDSLSKPFVRKIIPLIESEINKQNIVEHNLDYIKWLVNCEQEFIKIKSVNVFDNLDKLPVYDIELEPCKFFIAGNKPMNVFDTIRKFTKEPWSPIQLMQLGTVSPEVLAYLWLLVEHESNLMVIGSTASGKTTMLNTIAFFIPPAQRIVSIEDTHELSLMHENWLPSVARAGFGAKTAEGGMHGEVSLFDLLKESFRQRPDYVIVGEIRGKEAYVLFQGAASGHSTQSTMHAEDVQTMIRRLETPPINLSPSLVKTLHAVCVMTQAKVKGKPARRLREITEIIDVDYKTGEAKTNAPFVWDPRSDKFYFKSQSVILDRIAIQYGLRKEDLYREFQLRARLLMELYRRKIIGFQEVSDIIKGYYKNKTDILRKYGVIR